MTGKVIQGSFFGGQPKLPLASERMLRPRPPIQAKTAPWPPGPPPPGALMPASVGRPGKPKLHGANAAFAVDAGQLRLALDGGRPLPDAVRGKMEAAFGVNFADVRVHVGPQAERIGAIAFTMGANIYFAPGRYQPDTPQGQQLLGHELAHVVQQRTGRVCNPLGHGVTVVHDRALETQADRFGRRAAAHRPSAQPKMPTRKMQILSPSRGSALIPSGRGLYGADRRPAGNNSNHRNHGLGSGQIAWPAEGNRSNPLSIQRMWNPNVESKFKTQYGSQYSVTPGDVERKKYYGGVSSGNSKNIFYADEKTTDACKDARDNQHFKYYKIEQSGLGTVTISFFDRRNNCYFSAKLQTWPQVGLYTLDVVLKETGRNEGDDRFHIGDRIV
jgi:Domain of unknown function (DUF4157)